MLVLSRRTGESIRIDDQIEITVLEVRGSRIRLGIEAPTDIRIVRSEVWVDADQAVMKSA